MLEHLCKLAFSSTALFNLEALGKEKVETLYPSIVSNIYDITPSVNNRQKLLELYVLNLLLKPPSTHVNTLQRVGCFLVAASRNDTSNRRKVIYF